MLNHWLLIFFVSMQTGLLNAVYTKDLKEADSFRISDTWNNVFKPEKNLISQHLLPTEKEKLNEIFIGTLSNRMRYGGINELVEAFASKLGNNLTSELRIISQELNALLNTLAESYGIFAIAIKEKKDKQKGVVTLSKEIIDPTLVRIDLLEKALNPLKKSLDTLSKLQKDLALKRKILTSEDAKNVCDLLIELAKKFQETIKKLFDDFELVKKFIGPMVKPQPTSTEKPKVDSSSVALKESLNRRIINATTKAFDKKNLVLQNVTLEESAVWNNLLYGTASTPGIAQFVVAYASKFPNNVTGYSTTINQVSNQLLNTLNTIYTGYVSEALKKADSEGATRERLPDIKALLAPLKKENDKLVKVQKDLKAKILFSADAKNVREVLVTLAKTLEATINKVFDDFKRVPVALGSK